MLIRNGFEIAIDCEARTPLLLALNVHPDFEGRLIGEDAVRTDRDLPQEHYADAYGNRITRLVAPPGRTVLWNDFVAEVDGTPDPVVPEAAQHPVEDLPSETLQFLTASRYCDSDELGDFAWATFGNVEGGWAKVQAICDHAHEAVTFGYHFARPTKTAVDVHREKTGVCRDFAHLAIALCRAMNIPARYVSGYLGDIAWPPSGPGDFCAWFEAYLGGRWYTFDARYNQPRIGRVLMVRGGDAADAAMITSFGRYLLDRFTVWSDEVGGAPSDDELRAMLEQRPDAAPQVSNESSGRMG